MGIIPRLVADGEDIYPGRMPVDVVLMRIERLYMPFHGALARLIAETHRQFGRVLLVDCHSMPSTTVSNTPSPRPHFVIGDRFGTSCAREITQTVHSTLQGLGFEVHANRPYAGGFITEHYGRPQAQYHAIQIEINRALYLREASMEPSANFGAFTSVTETLIRALVAFSGTWALPETPRAAAE